MNQQVASPQAFAAAKSFGGKKPASESIIEDDLTPKDAGNGKTSMAAAVNKIEDEDDEIEDASDFVLEDDYIDIWYSGKEKLFEREVFVSTKKHNKLVWGSINQLDHMIELRKDM